MPKSIPVIHAATFKGAADLVGVADVTIHKAVAAGRLRVYLMADGRKVVDIRAVRKLYGAG